MHSWSQFGGNWVLLCHKNRVSAWEERNKCAREAFSPRDEWGPNDALLKAQQEKTKLSCPSIYWLYPLRQLETQTTATFEITNAEGRFEPMPAFFAISYAKTNLISSRKRLSFFNCSKANLKSCDLFKIGQIGHQPCYSENTCYNTNTEVKQHCAGWCLNRRPLKNSWTQYYTDIISLSLLYI